MRTRYQAYTLKENAYGTAYPSPTERTLDMSMLNGGLNLWDLEYRLSPNQSPDCLNVYWKDGSLSSRFGQAYSYQAWSSEDAEAYNAAETTKAEEEERDPVYVTADTYGAFYAGYERLWRGFWICQKGGKLYAVNPETGAHTVIYNGNLTEDFGGSFFALREKLYYMNGHEYIQISESSGAFTASAVTPYIPVTVINRKPNGTGGDIYEDENRLGAGKTVKFTADGTSTEYKLPYTSLDNTTVTAVVNGTSMTENSDFTVDRSTGVVTFEIAPSQSSLPVVNNVSITCYVTDTDAADSVLNCKCATAFTSGSMSIIVCGGTPKQPNAYFWNGSNAYGPDPTYFPVGNYNFAGANDEYITGFGKQQNMLVIFKEHSIGKTYLTTTDIDDLTYINLPYTPVNDTVGCSFTKSIRLVQNNLLFANKENGVHVLLDTSSAGENNVIRISRNVNGIISLRGLIRDLNLANDYDVCSYDDGERYWLCVSGNCYLWDYRISSFRSKEENLSWFLFDNIHPISWLKTPEVDYYGRADGSLVKFVRIFSDFGESYMRKYTFAVQHFGTYDVLKDVQRIIFAVRSDTGSLLHIRYRTDYEERDDLTLVSNDKLIALIPRDLLKGRNLKVLKFANTAIRIPRCFHIRHFSMTLYNDVALTDMSLIGTQIVYRYSRRDR